MKRLLCLFLLALLLCGCAVPGEEKTPTETTQPLPPRTVSVYLSDEICDKVTWRKVTDAFTATTGISITTVQDPAQAEVVHLSQAEATEFLASNPAAPLPALGDTQIPGETLTVGEKVAAGIMDSFGVVPDHEVQFLPLFCQSYGLGYNAALFQEKNWSVPTTWDELWTLAETAKAEGIYLLTYTDALQLRELMYATIYSVGGPEFFRSAAHYTEGVWSGQTGIACAEVMAKLAGYTHPVTPSKISAQCGHENLQLWLQNEVLFFPAGEDTAAAIAGKEKADGFELKIAPVMSGGAGQYTYLDTQPIWISGNCENPASAIRFLAYLYSDIATDLFREVGLTLPTVAFANEMGGQKMALGSFRTYHAAVDVGSLQKVFLDPFGRLVNGTITVQEWIRNTEDAMTAIRASLKS